MIQNNAPAARTSQVPRHDRGLQAQIIHDIDTGQLSQAAAAQLHGIARTTICSWMNRKAGLDADQQFIDFFTSPPGLALLHRLVCALHFVFGLVGLGSSRLMSHFLQLSGLSCFVASSKTVCNGRHQHMLKLTGSFAKQQQEHLARLMRADQHGAKRQISLCCDETFHPEVCLVAIEPCSNFIVLEHYAEDRKASTWILDARTALRQLPVAVTQVVVDGAGALAAMAKHFDAHLSPDLMHLLQPVSRKVLAPAAGKLSKAYSDGTDPRILEALKTDFEQIQSAVLEIKTAYHPVNLSNGHWQSCAGASGRIEKAFELLQQGVERMGLGKSARDAVSKSAGHIGEMIQTLGRAQKQRQQLLCQVELQQREAVDAGARGAYLEKMARSADADERRRLTSLADGLGGVEDEQWGPWVAQLMRIFERASSCVEGRNGYLSLCHHALHRLGQEHLEALTVIHNYVLRRQDGTTAAERFFGHPHQDLFEVLLEKMPFPAWPRAKRHTGLSLR